MSPELVDYLSYEPEENGILWIKFNRPERLNALVGTVEEQGTVTKVVEYMQAGDDAPNVRVIVLTGVGRAFCAGRDLKAGTGDEGLEDEGPDGTRELVTQFSALHRGISLIRKPTIAMVNGPAVGSGMDMALHCDIRIGCENTRFMGYQQVGNIMENGGCYYLPKLVGLGRALEFAYTGSLDAERALEWGLLNDLVPHEKLEETTRRLCERIIGSPPLVQWISKRIMRASLESSLETTSIMCASASGILRTSEDRVEARQAYREKRAPAFRGR